MSDSKIAAHLQEFVAVVESGSVSAAARNLGLPRVSVSRHIAALEEALEVQLLHRETRKLTLTAAGEELYRRGRRIVADVEEAKRSVAKLDGVPRGLLRIGAPNDGDMLAILADAYQHRYPDVQLELIGAQRHQDLIAEGIDVALRAGHVDDERLFGRQVASARGLAFRSPDLPPDKTPTTLEDLKEVPCIVGFDRRGAPVETWPLWNGEVVPVYGHIRTNMMGACLFGALIGMGVTMLPEPLARPHVESGTLVPVLPADIGTTSPLTVVWPATDYLDPKVRAFIDLAVELLPSMYEWRCDDRDCTDS